MKIKPFMKGPVVGPILMEELKAMAKALPVNHTILATTSHRLHGTTVEEHASTMVIIPPIKDKPKSDVVQMHVTKNRSSDKGSFNPSMEFCIDWSNMRIAHKGD
jgi:hypothetical protein